MGVGVTPFTSAGSAVRRGSVSAANAAMARIAKHASTKIRRIFNLLIVTAIVIILPGDSCGAEDPESEDRHVGDHSVHGI